MNDQQIALQLALNDAGISVSMTEFDDRLITQKCVYLLQKAGVHLGYRFRWYIRGPYCPELAADAFGVSAAGMPINEMKRSWDLDTASRRRISRVKKMWADIPDNSRARWLEIFASVHFLIDQEPNRANDISGLQRTLKEFKKAFSAEEIRSAIKTLRSHGLA